MAAGPICSDFGAPKNQVCHCFHHFPTDFPWNDETGCHDLSVEFKTTFFSLLFQFHQEALKFFNFCYNGGVICIFDIIDIALGNLGSSLCFIHPSISHDFSAYKLNKQRDNFQPWCTPFLIWNQCIFPCPVLTVAYWLAYRFLRSQVRWSGVSMFLRIFQFFVTHTVKGTGVVYKAEICFSVTLLLFFYDPTDVGNLISGSSAFSKSSLSIWKFTHVLLKPGLENLEHYFASMWDECSCVIVWTFFDTAFLCNWNENWPLTALWPLLSFPNLLAYWEQHF